MEYSSSSSSSSPLPTIWHNNNNTVAAAAFIQTTHTTTPTTTTINNNDNDAYHDLIIQVEQSVFLCCIVLVSVLALPPNVLLLHVCTRASLGRSQAGKRSLAGGPSAVSGPWRGAKHHPVLLVSQLLSNLAISLSSPLDVLFLAQVGHSDSVSCLLFLAVKSVLMLFSVLVVCLQGLDKVYRVHHLHNVLQRSRHGSKLLGLGVSLLLSALPLCLQLILTQGRLLQDGCRIRPVVVDVTETIFFLGFTLSLVSFVAVIVVLRRHRRLVGGIPTDDSRNGSRGSDSKGVSASPKVFTTSASPPRLPSVSEIVSNEPAPATENQTEEAATVSSEALPTILSPAWSPDNNKDTATTASRTQSLGDSARVPTIHLQRSPSLGHVSNKSVPVTSSRLLSPHARQAVFGYDDTLSSQPQPRPQHSQPAEGHSPHSSGVGVQAVSESSSLRPAACRANKASAVRWSKSLPRPPCGTAGRSLSALTLLTDRSRSVSTSSTSSTSATQRRLESAAVTAVKRGALSLVVFLVCYLPLAVSLLVLSLDRPVYETTLLVEGLTLPISYVHALVSPLLALRVDPEWREQASALLHHWCPCRCPCRGKTRP